MVKNLDREITHVIHKHKKSYKKAILRNLLYTASERITITIGVMEGLF